MDFTGFIAELSLRVFHRTGFIFLSPIYAWLPPLLLHLCLSTNSTCLDASSTIMFTIIHCARNIPVHSPLYLLATLSRWFQLFCHYSFPRSILRLLIFKCSCLDKHRLSKSYFVKFPIFYWVHRKEGKDYFIYLLFGVHK